PDFRLHVLVLASVDQCHHIRAAARDQDSNSVCRHNLAQNNSLPVPAQAGLQPAVRAPVAVPPQPAGRASAGLAIVAVFEAFAPELPIVQAACSGRAKVVTVVLIGSLSLPSA